MKIVITGAGGMLGTDLTHELCATHEILLLGRTPNSQLKLPFHHCDLRDRAAIKALIHPFQPDLIIHAAAMTEVDLCETQRDEAMADNVGITQTMVELSNHCHAAIYFFSTDYVFDGKKSSLYHEDDATNPINFYGVTKRLAEELILREARQFAIFRVSWLFGTARSCFPETMLKLSQGKNVLPVVTDQIGRPTWTKHIARSFPLIIQHLQKTPSLQNQIYHLCSQGQATWADFAESIFAQANIRCEVQGIKSAELNRAAVRPEHAVLNLAKTEHLLGIRLPTWQLALREYLAELKSMKPELFL